MVTAFQPNAFQNNAFQIVSVFVGSGGSGRKRRKQGLTRADVLDLLNEYKTAHQNESIPSVIREEALEVIKPYVKDADKVFTEDGLLSESHPSIRKLDLSRLMESSASVESLEKLLQKFRLWEEEEFCLLVLMAD